MQLSQLVKETFFARKNLYSLLNSKSYLLCPETIIFYITRMLSLMYAGKRTSSQVH